MVILGIIALALLTLVGYSAGVTFASGKQGFMPTIFDLFLVSLLWIIAFSLRSSFSHWLLLGVGLVLGLFTGYAATKVRLRNQSTIYDIPKSELPSHAREEAVTNTDTGFFKSLLLRWEEFATPMGNVQSRIIMGFFFFFFVTPFGLVTRLLTDPLLLKRPQSVSTWKPKDPSDQSIQSAKEQG